MINKQLQIIDSILGQLGGPVSYKKFNFKFDGTMEDFYIRFTKFVTKALSNLSELSEKDKVFLLTLVNAINEKLKGEGQTVTGYYDNERADAISALAYEIKVGISSDDAIFENLPDVFRI